MSDSCCSCCPQPCRASRVIKFFFQGMSYSFFNCNENLQRKFDFLVISDTWAWCLWRERTLTTCGAHRTMNPHLSQQLSDFAPLRVCGTFTGAELIWHGYFPCQKLIPRKWGHLLLTREEVGPLCVSALWSSFAPGLVSAGLLVSFLLWGLWSWVGCF